MKTPTKEASLFGFTTKEEGVFESLGSHSTPLEIARDSKISRPTVYNVLLCLKKRGLAYSKVIEGKRIWHRTNKDEILKLLDSAKNTLILEQEKHLYLLPKQDQPLTVHIGESAIAHLLRHVFESHTGERILSIQSTNVAQSYKNIFGIKGVNELNTVIKENKIIVDAILPNTYFASMFRVWGVSWAKQFEGRSTSVHTIDEKHIDNATDFLLFRDTLILIVHNEKLAYEIKSPELIQFFTPLFTFIKENSMKIDANAELRKLMNT